MPLPAFALPGPAFDPTLVRVCAEVSSTTTPHAPQKALPSATLLEQDGQIIGTRMPKKRVGEKDQLPIQTKAFLASTRPVLSGYSIGAHFLGILLGERERRWS